MLNIFHVNPCRERIYPFQRFLNGMDKSIPQTVGKSILSQTVIPGLIRNPLIIKTKTLNHIKAKGDFAFGFFVSFRAFRG